MTVNVGSFDRVVRALVGVALLGLPFVMAFSTVWTVVSVVIGVVMLAVAATRNCPLYSILGIKTCT